MLGEIRRWSLLGLKELTRDVCPKRFDLYFTSDDSRLPQHEKVLQWVGYPLQAADLLSSVGCPKDKAETSLGVLFTEVKCLASPYKNAALTQRLKHKYTSILFKRTGIG